MTIKGTFSSFLSYLSTITQKVTKEADDSIRTQTLYFGKTTLSILREQLLILIKSFKIIAKKVQNNNIIKVQKSLLATATVFRTVIGQAES